MIQLIYGLAGTCKGVYATHRAFLNNQRDGHRIAILSCVCDRSEVVSRTNEMYPEDQGAFAVIDFRNMFLDDLPDFIQNLSPDIHNVIVDDFGFLDMKNGSTSSIDRMAVLRKLHVIDRNIFVVTHGYHDICGGTDPYPIVPYPKLVNAEAGMIAIETKKLDSVDDVAWIRAGSVDFVFDRAHNKIIQWFDSI